MHSLLHPSKKNPFDSYYLSLAGVYAPKKEQTTAKIPKALSTFLDSAPNISHITLCLDNDETGRGASRFIVHKLVEKGYIVIDKPPRSGKDYNEYLFTINKFIEENILLY